MKLRVSLLMWMLLGTALAWPWGGWLSASDLGQATAPNSLALMLWVGCLAPGMGAWWGARRDRRSALAVFAVWVLGLVLCEHFYPRGLSFGFTTGARNTTLVEGLAPLVVLAAWVALGWGLGARAHRRSLRPAEEAESSSKSELRPWSMIWGLTLLVVLPTALVARLGLPMPGLSPDLTVWLLDAGPLTSLAESAGVDWMRQSWLYEHAETDRALRVNFRPLSVAAVWVLLACLSLWSGRSRRADKAQ